jgi:hypothetical protein
MAKASSKTASKAPKKTATSSPKTKTSTTELIEKVSEETLTKLKALGIEQELQNDLEWCLGSYRADHNPVGLYAMAERSLEILKQEKAKKTKGITAKTIADLEKVLQNR